MSAKLPVSVFMPVLNEELNIRAALASIQWADEVWVIDSHSIDRTAEIATALGARVVQFNYVGHGPKKGQWALENLPFAHEWVLLLAADERVTTALEHEIRNAIAQDRCDGYYLDRELVFLGRPLQCFRPNWSMRLFKHRLGRFEKLGTNVADTGDNEVHEHLVLSGRAGYLRSPFVNEDRRSIRTWLDNHNRYSEWEAHVYRTFLDEPLNWRGLLAPDHVWRKRAFKRIWVRLPLRPFARFFRFYIFRRGFLDGTEGFIYSALMGYYEFMISVKLRELESRSASERADRAGAPSTG
jgi:glycosyltransferase involved in cell wall biosynthesis